MLTFIFCILMIAVFGKIALFALKATWGILKVLLTLIFLPVILILMFVGGLVYLAFPLLILIGIISIIVSISKRA